ncbi:Indole-3-acetic acid-amido synthetase GH3.17 [Hibiscus syriacus]|uniref:Indole-3-acetic acid-amido synthetase GH3.17 n=1 Tax=Hibiscus syriacus TaxID=106335 RepID=A0A6A2YFE0_HIBSY|nr:Indole-3-acetic acid-amido synthetase GH3.17 [Hibiscus syriacus]
MTKLEKRQHNKVYISGTSGGQPKLIPVTAESADRLAISSNLQRFLMIKHVGDINQAGKRMELMFAKPEVETPSGQRASAASTRLFKGNEVVKIGSVFTSTVLRGIKFFENNWQELCSNIRTGQISDWITDSGCRNASSLIMKPDPELADLIENICRCESWHEIIRKLWPKTKYIAAVCTGAMMQYTAKLEFYCGGLLLVSGLYGCSEGAVGINLEPLCKPSDVSYTFLPSGVYYEFVPVKEECVTKTQNQSKSGGVSINDSLEMKSNDEDAEPVDLCKCEAWSIVGDVLMVTRFHNNAPQFRFIGRKKVALSVDVERTSEADLLKAVTEAEALLDPIGFILTEFTSYGDTSSTPGHYVIFWELKPKEGNDCNEVDPKVMEECCS